MSTSHFEKRESILGRKSFQSLPEGTQRPEAHAMPALCSARVMAAAWNMPGPAPRTSLPGRLLPNQRLHRALDVVRLLRRDARHVLVVAGGHLAQGAERAAESCARRFHIVEGRLLEHGRVLREGLVVLRRLPDASRGAARTVALVANPILDASGSIHARIHWWRQAALPQLSFVGDAHLMKLEWYNKAPYTGMVGRFLPQEQKDGDGGAGPARGPDARRDVRRVWARAGGGAAQGG
eukprot:scaffold46389_cov54-Phaeocystis_antarctica.AAC.1